MYADSRLTFRLPGDDLDFVRTYAHARRQTISEILVGYIRSLRAEVKAIEGTDAISPEVRELIGIVHLPKDLDEADYLNHLARKHA